jgi:hypothetical protein
MAPPGKAPPQCRAGWTQHILNGVHALPPALAARALGAVPVEHRSTLEQSSTLAWLPFEVHMAVLHALRSTLGARAYQQFCVVQITASLDHPMLFAKPAQLALRLYGAGPFALFRAIPPSLNYIFRNAGEFRIAIGESGFELDAFYEGFPAALSEGDTWSLIWTATLEAITAYAFEGTATHAHVSLTRQDPTRGYFEWHVRTSQQSEPPGVSKRSTRPPI